MLPLMIFANGGEQLFPRSFFHHVTVCARSESALCEDGFLKSRVNENQQSRTLRLERLKKFEAVTSTQPQCSQQQLRFAFVDFVARITNVVSLATDNHVWLRIQNLRDAVPKQRVLFQNQDACFYRMLFWGGHVRATHDCAVLFAIRGGANVKLGILPGLLTAENTEDEEFRANHR